MAGGQAQQTAAQTQRKTRKRDSKDVPQNAPSNQLDHHANTHRQDRPTNVFPHYRQSGHRRMPMRSRKADRTAHTPGMPELDRGATRNVGRQATMRGRQESSL